MSKFAIAFAAALTVTVTALPVLAAKTSVSCGDGKTVTISTTGGNCSISNGIYGSCTTTGEKDFTSGGCIGGKATCGASGGTGECSIALKSFGTFKPKVLPQIVPNAEIKSK